MENDMNKNPEIQGVMTPFPHSVGIDQTVQVAKDLMSKHNIRHLPVQEGGRLVGIVSDRDINFALGFELKRDFELTVEDVYTPEPYVVELTMPLDKVATRMAADHIGCALITQNEKLVGIFTTVDACRHLGELLRS